MSFFGWKGAAQLLGNALWADANQRPPIIPQQYKKRKIMIENIITQLQWRCQGKYRLRQYLLNYLQKGVCETKEIQIITPWCLSKSLEYRFANFGRFDALRSEKKVIEDFKWLHNLLNESELIINHFILLIGSSSATGQIPNHVSNSYHLMLEELVNSFSLDVLIEKRSTALVDERVRDELLSDPLGEGIKLEFNRRLRLAKKRNIWLTRAQALSEAATSVAVKASEARSLVMEFGDFALIPVEYVERYQYHNLGVDGFTDRLLPITQPYPWRL